MITAAYNDTKTFRYVRAVSASERAVYILGIGGLNKQALVRGAKDNLLADFKRQDGEVLTNITVDFVTTFLGPVTIRKAIVSGDIIRYGLGEEYDE